jgi:hypothetical protein
MFAAFFHALNVIPAKAGTQYTQPRGLAVDEARLGNCRA